MEKDELRDNLQHITYAFEVKTHAIEESFDLLKENVDDKIESIKSASRQVEHAYDAKIIEIKDDIKKQGVRITNLETSDLKSKAGKYDKMRNWIVSILLGALSSWLIINLQNILGIITTLATGQPK